MMTVELPDVLGWELPRAREECQALGYAVFITKTAPPTRTSEPAQSNTLDSDDENLYRVVAVKQGTNKTVMLVVCAEKW